MSLSDLKILEHFQLLDQLGAMEEKELLRHFTAENIEAMRFLSEMLKEDMELERVLSEKRFVNIVQELFETKGIWLEKLNETRVNAAQEHDQGNCVQALWILNGFIRFCPSPYYREMAEKVMEEYEKQ